MQTQIDTDNSHRTPREPDTVPTLSLTTRVANEVSADALVVGSVPGEHGAELAASHGLPQPAVVHIHAVLAALDATGAPGEVHRIVSVPGVRATTVVVVGLGAPEPGQGHSPDALRRSAGAALRSVREKSAVAVALPTPDVRAVGAVADGAYAGCYRYAKPVAAARGRGMKAATPPTGPKITLVSGAGQTKAVKDAITRAGVLADARDWARDLVNMPPNLLYPQTFVDEVKARVGASSAKISISVLDEKALAKGGFGGITGVGQGSIHPPRIVTMTYAPLDSQGTVALVGKGLTFDSGGVNLKTAAGMLTMKCDMAGAAAVAAAVLAAAELGVPVTVKGYLCLAENMPSGTAQRPSDVVVMRNGKTAEIIDTDAEGRMVLGDGLALACEGRPDVVVDIATLTGSQQIALGNHICAVMGNDDAFRDQVVATANAGGDQAWPMPLPEALLSKLESDTADLRHKGDADGGMLTAGLFLRHFVTEGTPWAHLDIAGPGWNDKAPHGSTPKGGTGFGVAALLGVCESRAAK